MPALDFPANPTNGQVYQNWIYSTSKGAWQAKPLTPAKTITDDVAPLNPADGDQWFSTVDGVLYIYVVDVDGGQWVESRSAIISDGYYSPNYIINGGFDIWQRGTSSTTDTAYLADRWGARYGGATGSHSRQALSPGEITGGDGAYFHRTTRAAGGVYFAPIVTKIEDARTLAGQTCTLSLWVKASSAVTGAAPFAAQVFGTGGSSAQSVTFPTTFNIGTTWSRVSVTFTMPSVVGKTIGDGSYIEFQPVRFSTTSAITVDIWGVQLESGSVATPFRRNANSIQGELAACQRYYNRITAQPGNNSGMIFGFQQTLATSRFVYSAPVKFRTVPSISFTNCDISDDITFATPITSFAVYSQSDPQAPYLILNHASSGSQNRPVVVRSQQANTSFIEFNAEL